MAEETTKDVQDMTEEAVVKDAETVAEPGVQANPDGSAANPASASSSDGQSPKEESAPPQEVEAEASPSEPPQKGEEESLQVKTLLDSSVQQVLAAFKGLKESFDSKLKYDAKKDAIIDRQFQELSQFKNGLVSKVTMQIVSDLIAEIDSAEKLVKFYEGAEFNEANYKKLMKVLKDIPASLCDVLEKYGVTSYRSTVGSAFNPKRQRALKTTETGDPSKDKTINELLRLGFEQEIESADGDTPKTKIVRSEMVDVFVYKEGLASTDKGDQPTSENNIEPASEQSGTEGNK